MRRIEIEAWTLQIVDQVAKRQPIEDSRVELKSTWPDAQKAARQIAAHANAARGDPILWLVGVDETAGVVGADPAELANWWPAVCRCFDDVHPELQNLNVPTGAKVIVALFMETDRAPYLIKNPAGGQIQFEVPWREGNMTRTARRADLIRMLEPQILAPSVDVLDASVTIPTKRAALWMLRITIFVAPRPGQEIIFPFHLARLFFSNGVCQADDWSIQIAAPTKLRLVPGEGPKFEPTSYTVFSSDSEVIFRGAGTATIEAHRKAESLGISWGSPAEVRCHLAFIHGLAPVVVQQTMQPAPPHGISEPEEWQWKSR